ncbi:Inosine-5'-monophosphate dehydrogenase [Defluviimonas aquaemixtae]|uniref:Inosine-5'-monophosphate dehydrogenase n=1 Tax=Albidovulum aquaemixtae TaxID=1542388 RepID=A0A2R8B500_9RHOB|nr:CBS domain-containing protein [Defluviimonas aquaemixtae]SPH17679.1 Inosine-5'-monophosphate dehydrogenase [Defluviimonas aquaemixtae]
MQVHQILRAKPKTDIITVAPGTSVADAARLLAERRIGAVVVSEDGKVPLGILSERDIVRDLGRRGSGCLTDTVDSLMTRNLISCGPKDVADSVLEKMTTGRFRHMPVMEEGKMVGIISIGDVVAARISELAMEKDALEGMIMGN